MGVIPGKDPISLLLNIAHDNNYTTTYVTRASGLPERTVCDVLSGKSREPRYYTIQMICQAMNLYPACIYGFLPSSCLVLDLLTGKYITIYQYEIRELPKARRELVDIEIDYLYRLVKSRES